MDFARNQLRYFDGIILDILHQSHDLKMGALENGTPKMAIK